jgi:DNA-binding transcriptional regulator YiaG
VKEMKKAKDTNELEAYLEAHASELKEAKEENGNLIRAAKMDEKRRKDRAARLQKLRRDKLHLSQRDLARAVGANLRTLQSWERGRQDFPKSVEILMSLMEEIPGVKKRLLPTNKK